MARLPCKQSSSPSQQTRVNNFGNTRNPYWDMQQARHPAPPYVRNHHRHTDHTGESLGERIANRISNRCFKTSLLTYALTWRKRKEISTHVFRNPARCETNFRHVLVNSIPSESANLRRQKRGSEILLKYSVLSYYTIACELIPNRVLFKNPLQLPFQF